MTAIAQFNRGEHLFRAGRFEEARDITIPALVAAENGSDPSGLMVTYPLRTLGLCYLELGCFDNALAALERASALREANDQMPVRLAEVHFPLARAVEAASGDRVRAVALAQRARHEYALAPSTPLVEKELAELEAWLAAHPASTERS